METTQETQGNLSFAAIIPFLFAGNATLTLSSERTGTHYTFRVKKSKAQEGKSPVFFVGLLAGPDNQADYQYIGIVPNDSVEADTPKLIVTKKSRMNQNSGPVKALRFLFTCLERGELHPSLRVYHEGRCGRCNRVLTVPESIETGLGPVCAEKGFGA